MKKIWTLMAMVAVFASCSQEEADSPLNTYTLTGYADVESRTAFGTPGTNKIPFTWSAGDYIYVGQAKSNAINNEGSNANFTFNVTPTGNKVYYNLTGESNQAKVKREQTVGNLGANGDFGYSTKNGNSFSLNHATAYVWFDTTLPSGATLQTITLDAGSNNIAGNATWNGSDFGTISNGSTSVNLTVNKSSVNGAELAMVIFPTNFSNATVTYQWKTNSGDIKSYKKTLGNKQVTAGKTWKISTNLNNVSATTLKVLTFEDEDANFEEYYVYGEYSINTWSDLIDPEQQFGDLLYNYSNPAQCEEDAYRWYDKGNTELAHIFPYNYYSYMYSGGGHAISNYASFDYVNYGDFMSQLTVYGEEGAGGHNSSSNFAMHFGYIDGSSYNKTEELSSIKFADNTPRIIDHIYINISTYLLNCVLNGNGLTDPVGENDWVKIVASGWDKDGNMTGSSVFIICEGGTNNIVTEWTKWDLSSLGKVVSVQFNVTGSNDNGYGFSQPAYFAYDDVTVQF